VSVQVVDPAFSRAVFERELGEFRALEITYRANGCLVLDATFPKVYAMVAAVHVGPTPPIMFGLELDYTNYPVDPPGLRFIHALTRQPVTYEQLPNHMPRGRLVQMAIAEAPAGAPQQLVMQTNDLILRHEGGPPFLCHPGVLEYHRHPAHTGDAWELHPGEGRVNRILDIVHRFGVQPARPSIQMLMQYPVPEPAL
jgi:hypothetical protein